jgi:hypothetical protein
VDAALSRSINYDCFEPLVEASKNAGVRRINLIMAIDRREPSCGAFLEEEADCSDFKGQHATHRMGRTRSKSPLIDIGLGIQFPNLSTS